MNSSKTNAKDKEQPSRGGVVSVESPPGEAAMPEKKVCFVVMPISDTDGYDSGHFARVYKHIIRPACEKAGYTPVRADDVESTNYIIIDILQKIISSSLVLCDLSGRNPNVLYELGIRHAFNLPAVLIKDSKTDRMFDIQGIRCVEYNYSLRIDEVEKSIDLISNAINETVSGGDRSDFNSLIQLLEVKPASVPSTREMSPDSSVILSSISALSKRLDQVVEQTSSRILASSTTRSTQGTMVKLNDSYYVAGDDVVINGEDYGRLVHAEPSGFMTSKGGVFKFHNVRDDSNIEFYVFLGHQNRQA